MRNIECEKVVEQFYNRKRACEELKKYRKKALKIAGQFYAGKDWLDKIKSAKNETQIANIMGDIRRAL